MGLPHRRRVTVGPGHAWGIVLRAALIVLAAAPAAARGAEVIVIGDHANSFNAIDFLSPNIGFAQQFTLTAGASWDITRVRIRLGNQSIYTQIDPTVQVRDAAPGGGPGANILGAFTIDGSQIPPWTFGGVNTAIVNATPDSPFTLAGGTYWLALLNLDSGDAILACYTSDSPLIQSGVGGTIDNFAPIYQSTNGGATFSPAYGGYALLTELDGTAAIPEPTCAGAAVIFLAPLLRRRRSC